jgi:hypothetical protein
MNNEILMKLDHLEIMIKNLNSPNKEQMLAAIRAIKDRLVF